MKAQQRHQQMLGTQLQPNQMLQHGNFAVPGAPQGQFPQKIQDAELLRCQLQAQQTTVPTAASVAGSKFAGSQGAPLRHVAVPPSDGSQVASVAGHLPLDSKSSQSSKPSSSESKSSAIHLDQPHLSSLNPAPDFYIRGGI